MQVTIFGIIFFLVMLTVLVAAHELGHYLFARMFKMDVEEFAIGLGRPKWVWMRRSRKGAQTPAPSVKEDEFGEPHAVVQPAEESNETEYTFRAWPLGGFVRVKGMMPEEDGSEIHIQNGFYSKPPWQRFLVLLAGPLFSVVAGIVLLTGLYAVVGIAMPSKTALIGSIGKGLPAERAGLRVGDRITEVNGTEVQDFYDVSVILRDRANMATEIRYERDGQSHVTIATPKEEMSPIFDREFRPTGEERKVGKIGFGPKFESESIGLGAAFVQSVELPWKIVSRLVSTLKQPSRLKDEVGGPVAIFGVAQKSAEIGMPAMVETAGMLSISLGIINLLPAVPFDGGQMMVAFVEMLRRGRRLSFKVQTALLNAGITFIVLMVVSVLFIDINRLRGG